MITEDNIAAATLAKIFGGELLRVQENARTDSGSTPEVVKMHPKQFLVNQPQQNQVQQNSQLLNMLQREAEMAYPLTEEPKPLLQPVSPPVAATQTPATPTQPVLVPDSVPEVPQLRHRTPIVQTLPTSGDVWERICSSLERIANKLDTLELTAKKAKQKRRPSRHSIHETNTQ